jgi:hypothetical protein
MSIKSTGLGTNSLGQRINGELKQKKNNQTPSYISLVVFEAGKVVPMLWSVPTSLIRLMRPMDGVPGIEGETASLPPKLELPLGWLKIFSIISSTSVEGAVRLLEPGVDGR